MSFFEGLFSSIFDRPYVLALRKAADQRTIIELCDALLGSHGEISGGSLAQSILARYALMDRSEKQVFFEYLRHGLGIVPDDVSAALSAYHAKPSGATYRAFAAASEPRRQELARRLNQVPGATGKLVEMRLDLLDMMRADPNLAPLDVDFKHLFTSWFNRGFLVLHPINWDSPATILEKIIAYEAVHAIDSWEDLRRRLRPSDRRCYGFFHPAMADEPLIFVEVALTRGVAKSVQGLLADERETLPAEEADTAVFYSISNCQAGLAGISFGNSLIKQVVADLARDLPQLKTFVTLSPIPAMMGWAEKTASDTPDKAALAAHYLLNAKRGDGMPYDPVARFHLGNGAQIHAVHADADTSDNGMRQSGGVMVNYLYDLAQIAQNHEGFVEEKTVNASGEVRKLAATIARDA